MSDTVTTPTAPKQDLITQGIGAVMVAALVIVLLFYFGGPQVRAWIPYTPESRIIGKWYYTDTLPPPDQQGNTREKEFLAYEFFRDGTVILPAGHVSSYRFLDQTRFHVRGYEGGVYEARFRDGDLILRDELRGSSRYYRLK